MKKPKFKIGDKVINISGDKDIVETVTAISDGSVIGLSSNKCFYLLGDSSEWILEIHLNSVEPKEFTLSDLQDWDIVELRNKNRYFVNKKFNKIVRDLGNISIFIFEDDMKHRENADYDIMKVYRGMFVNTNIKNMILEENGIIYSRNEKWKPKYKENYYIPHIGDNDLHIQSKWVDAITDSFRYENNLVFKTKEEAIEATTKMLAALKGE